MCSLASQRFLPFSTSALRARRAGKCLRLIRLPCCGGFIRRWGAHDTTYSWTTFAKQNCNQLRDSFFAFLHLAHLQCASVFSSLYQRSLIFRDGSGSGTGCRLDYRYPSLPASTLELSLTFITVLLGVESFKRLALFFFFMQNRAVTLFIVSSYWFAKLRRSIWISQQQHSCSGKKKHLPVHLAFCVHGNIIPLVSILK